MKNERGYTNPTQGVDYKLLLPEEDTTAVNIELMGGTFDGVIYTYGKVNPGEETEEGAVIGFQFEILDSNGLDNLEENEEFRNYMGDILVSIVTSNIISGE